MRPLFRALKVLCMIGAIQSVFFAINTPMSFTKISYYWWAFALIVFYEWIDWKEPI